MPEALDPLSAFIEAAYVPLDGGHTRGTLEGAHPEVCRSASGKTAVSLATRRERADVLESVSGLLFPSGYPEVDALLKSHGAVA